MYSGTYNQAIYCDETSTEVYNTASNNNQYSLVNPKYEELKKHASHIYDTIQEKQETEPKNKPSTDHNYCYIGVVNNVPSDKKLKAVNSITSDDVPVSFKLEDRRTSNEEDRAPHNEQVSSYTKPITAPLTGTRNDSITSEHLHSSRGYASLDITSRNPVHGEYQKPIIQSTADGKLPSGHHYESPDTGSHVAAVSERKKSAT